RRSAALPTVGAVMNRLRSATSVGTLLDRTPREVGRSGYDRCLVSRVENGRWIARAAYVKDDAGLAAAITAAGREAPRLLDGSLLETDLVRRRQPVLVTDPHHNPRVHRDLIEVTGTRAYVAAPVVVGRRVVAMIHADESSYSAVVDRFDRELVGLLAESLGFAAERALYRDRLTVLRRTLVQASSSALDLVDELVGGLPAAESAADPGHDRELLPHLRPAVPAALESLTARELEVLERMAAGDTNGQVASALFISEATVKAHVKHIFRKLNAANRAEAVCRYLRG
ncbi:LuxR C-terminal-related transcriptional regulator, partial [Pseudonocardia pini]|uniref:LuxR C-terminal-related transcriptional regulator n=1 Tax=Pseudonocardia pini TaxID=2758030 RepID=UPI001C68D7F5